MGCVPEAAPSALLKPSSETSRPRELRICGVGIRRRARARRRGPARRGRWPRDPPGRRPHRRTGRAARPDGSERIGQVHPRQHPRRQPGLPGDQGPDRVPGRRGDGLATRRPCEGGDVPRLPVPRGDPGGAGVAIHAPGRLGAARHGDLGARGPSRPHGVDASASTWTPPSRAAT